MPSRALAAPLPFPFFLYQSRIFLYVRVLAQGSRGLVKEYKDTYSSGMNGLTRENNNEEKEDGTKKRNKRLFIVAIVSTVVWSVVFGIFFILKFISGQSSTKWDLFLNGWSMLLGLPVHCWAMYVKNSSFIEKIGNYLWKLFFDRAISTKEVQPYYEEIGNRIIVAQRGEKFYDAIYKNRTDMFDNKKLYQESGTSIT
ncbi:MAG: hypothetical protein LBC88_08010, partial [Spirochaetaceae bacterium]|nr:hypothetical protein [Spirochaetaceae bacterium]